MCSVNDGELSLMEEENIKKLLSDTLCRKCNSNQSIVVLQKKFQYCFSCLDELVSHKFFSALGKERVMKPSDRVLFLCSGSQSCSVLLQLAKTGVEKRKKKILSELVVLFVDDGCYISSSPSERKAIIADIHDMVSHYSFKCYYSGLVYNENSLKDMETLEWCTEEFLTSNKLCGLIESISSLTSQQELLVKLRTSVAVKVAKKLDCNRIFSAETADHMACRILSNIALGRGGQLPHDIGLTDSRFEVLWVRPLKDCTRKEVAVYRHFSNLPYVIIPKLEAMGVKPESIQKASEKFVADLLANFPSTVNAIIGTGKKLDLNEPEEKLLCLLCKSAISEDKNSLSAIKAQQLSHEISILGSDFFNAANLTTITPDSDPSDFGNTSKISEKSCKNCACSEKCFNFTEVRQFFCFSCQLILSEMKNLSLLPLETLTEIQSQKRLDEMRSEIKEFLLD